MSDLEETFGESFVAEFQSEKQRRRQERERVSEEAMDSIAEKIVSGEEFTGENPMMSYTTDSGITHHALLMTVPDPDGGVWKHLNELDSGAVTLPLDYLGNWMSCLFNDGEEVKELIAGNEYIIIGELGQWETDSGEKKDQMSPVRGVMTLEEVKKRASGEMEVSEGSSEPEDDSFNEGTPEEDEEEEEDSGSSFGGFGSDDEEEEEDDELPEVSDETVYSVLNEFPEEKQEQVLELEEGDEELTDVATYVMKQDGYEEYNEDVASGIIETVLEWIDDNTEEEEEEDDSFGGDEDSLFGS